MKYLADMTKAWPTSIARVLGRVVPCLGADDSVDILLFDDQEHELNSMTLDDGAKAKTIPRSTSVPEAALRIAMDALSVSPPARGGRQAGDRRRRNPVTPLDLAVRRIDSIQQTKCLLDGVAIAVPSALPSRGKACRAHTRAAAP
jgi:hypothetical protein